MNSTRSGWMGAGGWARGSFSVSFGLGSCFLKGRALRFKPLACVPATQ